MIESLQVGGIDVGRHDVAALADLLSEPHRHGSPARADLETPPARPDQFAAAAGERVEDPLQQSQPIVFRLVATSCSESVFRLVLRHVATSDEISGQYTRPMTKTEVLDLLEENRDARGEANWKEMGDRTGGMTSFGIGLTKLRAIAKRVGRDHDLALKLWNERNHDAKVIGLLIDDPKQLTRDQVEKQVDGAGSGMLSHVLSSCDATLPKSPLAFEIAKDWMSSTDPVRRRCGYGLVYELAKDKKDKRLVDEFFLGCVEKIGKTIAKEENSVRVGMGGALLSIGKRNKKLNAAAIKVARAIGPIHFSDGDRKCEPMDVLKHLTSDYLRDKLGA